MGQICLRSMSVGDLLAYASGHEVDEGSFSDLGWFTFLSVVSTSPGSSEVPASPAAMTAALQVTPSETA